MKRGQALQRKSAMKPRATWMPRQRATPRRSSRILDESYLAWVRRQRCAVALVLGRGDCWGPTDPEHERQGVGMGQVASDSRVWPCCRSHHVQRHSKAGNGWTAGMDRSHLRAFITERIAEARERYLAGGAR